MDELNKLMKDFRDWYVEPKTIVLEKEGWKSYHAQFQTYCDKQSRGARIEELKGLPLDNRGAAGVWVSVSQEELDRRIAELESAPIKDGYFVDGSIAQLISDNIDDLFEAPKPSKETK